MILADYTAENVESITKSYRIETQSGTISAGYAAVRVRDPLSVEDASYNVSEGRLIAYMRNVSERMEYEVEGIEGGKIGPGEVKRIVRASENPEPYQPHPVELIFNCRGREAVKYSGKLSWNPAGGGHTLAIPENGARWGDTKASATRLHRESA